MVACFYVCEQNITAVEAWDRRHSYSQGSEKRGIEEKPGQDITKDMSLVTNFLQVGSTSQSFHHCKIRPPTEVFER